MAWVFFIFCHPRSRDGRSARCPWLTGVPYTTLTDMIWLLMVPTLETEFVPAMELTQAETQDTRSSSVPLHPFWQPAASGAWIESGDTLWVRWVSGVSSWSPSLHGHTTG